MTRYAGFPAESDIIFRSLLSSLFTFIAAVFAFVFSEIRVQFAGKLKWPIHR